MTFDTTNPSDHVDAIIDALNASIGNQLGVMVGAQDAENVLDTLAHHGYALTSLDAKPRESVDDASERVTHLHVLLPTDTSHDVIESILKRI